MARSIRTVSGSYGSAGGGGNALRRTTTAVGAYTTPTVVAMRDSMRLLPARLDEPSIDDIWRSIRTQQCCWCLDTRTFRSLSGHWVKGHGIDLQEIRDRLEVPKAFPFISIETAAIQSANSKKHYDPEVLKNKGGPRKLSAFGLASQKRKSSKLTPEARSRAQLSLGAERLRERSDHMRSFIIKTEWCSVEGCQDPFVAKGYCSKHYQRAQKGELFPDIVNLQAPADRVCGVCGRTFNPRKDFGNSNRLTCSPACHRTSISERAKSRVGHIARIGARGREVRKERALAKRCSYTGCDHKHIAKGLCGMHYQRQAVVNESYIRI